MKYTLLISASVRSGGSARACEFAHALLDAGHTLERVFFIDRGVDCALNSIIYAQDEGDVTAQWDKLHERSDAELTVCSASAAKYGLVHIDEAKRLRKPATLHQAFTVGGLGLLQASIAASDRVVNFNG